MSAQCIGFEASLLFTSHKAATKAFSRAERRGAPPSPDPAACRLPHARPTSRNVPHSHFRTHVPAPRPAASAWHKIHASWQLASCDGSGRSQRAPHEWECACAATCVRPRLTVTREAQHTLVALPASRLSRNPQASCNGGRERSVRLHAMGRTALTDRALHCALPHRDERRDRLAHERRQGSRRRRRRRRRRWQRWWRRRKPLHERLQRLRATACA